MSERQILLSVLAIVMMLILVGRRFWSGAVPAGRAARLALIWVALIAGLWVVTTFIRS
ncbi:hypothetical protein [uncultured Sphingomonas sp.]|uniref:hypothetical protein n=1 Tax=uncultured Sphingomonas sp. TaxID=158754 RepID=UPI0025F352C2|nr:hypothetical protein [uncultured Sphingomonas sp.]